MKRGTKSSARAGETTKPPTSSMTYGWRVDGGAPRAWSHCRFVLPLIHFIQDSLTSNILVSLFPNRKCDRTLGAPRQPGYAGRVCRCVLRALTHSKRLDSSTNNHRVLRVGQRSRITPPICACSSMTKYMQQMIAGPRHL